MCTVAIDYDGTITADFDLARKYIGQLRDAGHYVIIWSSRNNPVQHKENQPIVMADMITKMVQHDIPYDEIDYGEVGKLHAQVYIDDKAWRFENNWAEIIERIY